MYLRVYGGNELILITRSFVFPSARQWYHYFGLDIRWFSLEDSTDACIFPLYLKPQVHSCTLKSVRVGFAFGQNIILIWRILRSDDIDLRTSFEFQIRCCKPRVHFKLQKFDKNRLLILLWSCIIAFVEQSVGLTALALIAFFGSRQRFGIGGCSY